MLLVKHQRMAFFRKRGKKVRTSKFGRRYRRRVYRRRSKVRRFLPTALPNIYTCRLRYVEQFSLNPDNTGAVSYHVFKCDGLYDPNSTGVGHQPMGFDQLCGMYEKFQVMGSKIKVSPCPDSSNAINNTSAYGVCRMNTSSEISGFTLDRLLENDSTSKNVRICGAQTSLAWNNNPQNSMSNYFSARKTYGKGYLGDSDHQGTAAGDPTQLTYWAVWACAPIAGTDPTISYWIAQIDYIVRFTDPVMMVQS